MRLFLLPAALLLLLLAPAFAEEGEGGDEEDGIKALKKILEKMDAVEKLLAKAQIADGAAGQEQVEKELKKLIEEGKLKQDDVLDDISRQPKVVSDKMKDIDLDIDKIIQAVKMHEGQGQGGMEISSPKGGKDQEKPKGKRADQQKELEENVQGKEQQGDPAKGKTDPKEGEKKTGEGGSEGSDPAKKPYTAGGRNPQGGSRRAAGEGRWGFLPDKEYREAMAQNDLKVPEKYRALISKFWELLAKKADEEERK